MYNNNKKLMFEIAGVYWLKNKNLLFLKKHINRFYCHQQSSPYLICFFFFLINVDNLPHEY